MGRPPQPGQVTATSHALAPRGQLLQRPGVAVGVAEEDEKPHGVFLHLADVDAPGDKLRAGRLNVGTTSCMPLDRTLLACR